MELVNVLSKNTKEISKYLASKLKGDVKISNGRVYIWNKDTKLFEATSDLDDAIINAIGTYMNDELETVLIAVSEETSSKKKKSVSAQLLEDDISQKVRDVQDLQKTYTKTGTIRQLLPYLKAEFKDNTFYERIDSERNTINYKNGVLNLQTGKFRARTKDDAYSKCLNYDYSSKTDEKVSTHIKTILLQICNDDPELLEFMLLWLGYSITGEVKEQKIMCFMGRLAANGKSTIMQIFSKVFSTYCAKVGQAMVNMKSQDQHKFMIMCEKPTRVVYIEEVDGSKLDPSTLKDFSGGDDIPCKLMYGTMVLLAIHAKLWMTINGIPRFETDNGIERRFLASEHKNQFRSIDDPKYMPNTKGHYIAKKNLLDVFNTQAYRTEFMNILLDYTKKYYKKGLKIPKFIQNQGAEICSLNDNMNTFINDRFEITDNEGDRIGKDSFLGLFHDVFNCKTPWITVLADAKRCNLVYDKEKRFNGIKGCFTNLKLNEDEDDNDQDDIIEKVNVNKNIIFQDPYEEGVITKNPKIVPVVFTKPTIKKKHNKGTMGITVIDDLLS